jgi:RNA polymerase sigma factor (sigma-70 family)
MSTELGALCTLTAADLERPSVRSHRAEDLHWAGRCRTTHWSVIFAAAAGGPSAQAALSRLYRAYWYPLFAIVAKARGREAAAELTQKFIVERLVDAGDLRRVSQRPGKRFRGWLFTALRSFLKNQWVFERQQCRDVRRTVAFVDDADSDGAGPKVADLADSTPDPEQQLDRKQALRLVSAALERLRQEYCVKARAAGVDGALRFEALKAFIPGTDAELERYRSVAQALGMSTEAVKQLVSRLRRNFGEVFVDELVKSGACDGDIAARRRQLQKAVSNSKGPRVAAKVIPSSDVEA